MEGIKRVTAGGFIIPETTQPGKRFQWLANMITKRGYKIGAEIGAHNGNTTSFVLQACPTLETFFAVDLWAMPPKECSDQYDNWNFELAWKTFRERTRGFRACKVIRAISWEAAEQVEDNSLDFIFIDADHKYESVCKDIKAWTPKLKPGGMISGHDTHFEGVRQAIDELIPNWLSAGIDHCWFADKEDVL